MLPLMLVGYGCQPEVTAESPSVPAVPTSPLREALFAVNVKPLDKTLVAADQAGLLKKTQFMYRACQYCFLLSVMFWIIAVMAVVSVFFVEMTSPMIEFIFADIFFAIACTGITIYWICKNFYHGIPRSAKYITWQVWSLDQWLAYQRIVPDAALKKVEILRRQLPEVAFCVEWMDTDPYLIASLGDEYEHIHQWG